ncbi:MAG: hypothetical protein ACI89J_002048, partial [Hyphomicrobiaceae bacterium]
MSDNAGVRLEPHATCTFKEVILTGSASRNLNRIQSAIFHDPVLIELQEEAA